MYILGINISHHGSICLLKDGEVLLFLEEERLSGNKYSLINDSSFKVLSKIKEYTSSVDYIALLIDGNHAGMPGLDNLIIEYNEDALKHITNIIADKSTELYKNFDIQRWNLVSEYLTQFAKPETKLYIDLASHHNIHAVQSFYNSGFKEAVCVVVDGQGTSLAGDCTDTIFERESIWKISYTKCKKLYQEFNTPENGIGSTYSRVTKKLGFKQFEEGKTMGLSSYDNEIAKSVQAWSQEKVLNLIKLAIDKSKCKNVCVSGGYGLNCVANYYYRKSLPNDINLYCEPVSNDAGHAIGLAIKVYRIVTGDTTIKPQTTLYLGS